MNPFPIRGAACLDLLLCLAACGSSPPNQYYRLVAQADPGTTGEQPALGIGPVNIPDYLRRGGIVYSSGGNQLLISDQQRWAEPLDEGIERVVAINLARLLHTDNLRLFPWQLNDIPDYTIEVVVLELGTQDAEAVLVADWVIRRPAENASVTRKISRLRHALPPGPISPADLAPAYSMLFNPLSELIGAAISAAESVAPATDAP
jgi:uncharacterized lipoprotein YmbA